LSQDVFATNAKWHLPVADICIMQVLAKLRTPETAKCRKQVALPANYDY
jgi:hypothetical protein